MTLTTATQSPATRAYSDRIPKWQRFQTNVIAPSNIIAKAEVDATHPYLQQYSHVYYQRLNMLRPRCWRSVELQETNDSMKGVLRVERILELAEGQLSTVVGTVVRESGDDKKKLHPDSQCRANDALYLEDESGRVKLRVEQKFAFPTGIVLGVRGTVGSDGVFHVSKLYSPTQPDYLAAPELKKNASGPTPHLLLVSGLHCGDPAVSSLPRDLLVSFLEGRFGIDKANSISRIILAGGLTSTDPTAIRELDGFCLSLAAAGIPLDIFPGSDDPTTANWPQRPLHRALLSKSDQHLGTLVSRTPNPYAALHNGMYVVGTDGTNIKDLCQYVLTEETTDAMAVDEDADPPHYVPISPLAALGRTLEWCHLCPTGPDSVPTAPHATQDPMVLDEACPSVYFCGNADQFATKLCNNNRTRLIVVPSFSKTGEAVLVNLESLAVELLRFEE